MRVPAGTSYTRNQVIIGREAPDIESELHWWVGSTRAGQANFTLKDTDGVSHFTTAEPDIYTNLHDGEWHHIAAVRLGSQGRLRIYVDGVQEGGAIADDYTGTFGSLVQPINVGWLNYSADLRFHYDGDLDELAIYRRVLTPSEILAHAQNRRPYCISASLNVNKTASSTSVIEGDTVDYTYVVTNDGNENLRNVTVSDNECSPVTGPQGTDLAVGASATFYCSQSLTENTENTATATGYTVTGVQISDTDTVAVTVTPADPSVEFTKQANKDLVVAGDEVTYTYNVTNNGNVDLTNLVVSDDKCSPVTGPQGTTLAVGASETFVCVQALTEATTNTGTVTANHQGPGGTFTEDSAAVTVHVAGISLDKTASPTTIEPGETVNYTYNVRNIGDVVLTNVVVTDDKCSPIHGGVPSPFNPGQSAVLVCSQTLNETTTNTGTVTANYSGGTITARDTATVRIGTYYIYLPIALSRYR
jgi:hypothetical protein